MPSDDESDASKRFVQSALGWATEVVVPSLEMRPRELDGCLSCGGCFGLIRPKQGNTFVDSGKARPKNWLFKNLNSDVFLAV